MREFSRKISFFKATYNTKTNSSLIFCQLESCGSQLFSQLVGVLSPVNHRELHQGKKQTQVYLLVIHETNCKTFHIEILNNSLKTLHSNITLTHFIFCKTYQSHARNQKLFPRALLLKSVLLTFSVFLIFCGSAGGHREEFWAGTSTFWRCPSSSPLPTTAWAAVMNVVYWSSIAPGNRVTGRL